VTAADRVRARDGFTVLETVVALLILGLALTPLLGSTLAGVRETAKLRSAHEAVSLAEARMASLEVVPVDSIAFYRVPRVGWFPPPFGGFRWRAILRADPATPALVRGAVLVEWKTGTYSLETVFHRPDLLPAFAPAR
jgi:diadenosine tetraphosphatase ApaH/serine/threonine PP2A family protein phosphatase